MRNLGTIWFPEDPLPVAVSSGRSSTVLCGISRRSPQSNLQSMLVIANALDMSASSLKAA